MPQQEQKVTVSLRYWPVGPVPPSTERLKDLMPIELKDLHDNYRHLRCVCYFHVIYLQVGGGARMRVKDCSGKDGLVWSHIDYPCPGDEQALAAGTIIAVKEPVARLKTSPAGDQQASYVFVDSPSDILRISKYAPGTTHFFPQLSAPKHGDYLAAGHQALSNPMDAIDIYSQGITSLQFDIDTMMEKMRNGTYTDQEPEKFDYDAIGWMSRTVDLYIHRARAYIAAKIYPEALGDLLFGTNTRDAVKRQRVLEDLCRVFLELNYVQAAQIFAKHLLLHAPDKTAGQNIYAEVQLTVRQLFGNIDLDALASDDSKSCATFVGDIHTGDSMIHRRGIFAEQKFAKDDLLLCEKPVAVHQHSSESETSLEQLIASSVISSEPKARQLFDLFDGNSRQENSITDEAVTYDT